MLGVGSMLQSMGQGGSQDVAVELGRRLFLRSVQSILDTFQSVATDDAVGNYLIVTTTMPFALKYSAARPVKVIAEVEHELRLNCLAQLLLHDRAFRDVTSPAAFRRKAASLFQARREEVERLKQQTIAQV